jgi:hypothetical protein
MVHLALLAGLVGGCAWLGSGGQSDPFRDGPSREAERTFTLQVDNDNFSDARIEILWNGSTEHLGMVRGSSRQTFRLEPESQTFRLRIEFTGGGGRYDTPTLQARPGQSLRYRIPRR